MTPVLIEAIKAQQAQLHALKNEIDQIKKAIAGGNK